MITLENNEKLHEVHSQGRKGTSKFNCWSATLFILGVVDYLEWTELDDITDFIETRTVEVDDVKEGDILVLYGYEEDEWFDDDADEEEVKIIHTAIFLSKNRLFHKKGGEESEFTNIEGIKEVYFDFEDYTVRRLVK